MTQNRAFSTGAHPLNLFLAEELAHYHLALQLSEDRQHDMRARLVIASEEIVRARRETHRARRDVENRDRTITRLMDSNSRFRSTFAEGIRRRAFPEELAPTLRRVRDATQNMRDIARRDIVGHFRALRERVIAENPLSGDETETDDEGDV